MRLSALHSSHKAPAFGSAHNRFSVHWRPQGSRSSWAEFQKRRAAWSINSVLLGGIKYFKDSVIDFCALALFILVGRFWVFFSFSNESQIIAISLPAEWHPTRFLRKASIPAMRLVYDNMPTLSSLRPCRLKLLRLDRGRLNEELL